jgi:hypothetical protein
MPMAIVPAICDKTMLLTYDQYMKVSEKEGAGIPLST